MPQGPTIYYQGRRPMARSNPTAERWGEFVRTRLALLGMSQADLRRAMEAEGHPISRQAASQWFKGENAADPNMAAVAAAPLRVTPATAMREAGYGVAVDRLLAGAGDSEKAVDAADPIAEEIMGMTFLGLKVRQALLAEHLADKEDSARRLRNLAKAWAAQNGDDSAA